MDSESTFFGVGTRGNVQLAQYCSQTTYQVPQEGKYGPDYGGETFAPMRLLAKLRPFLVLSFGAY